MKTEAKRVPAQEMREQHVRYEQYNHCRHGEKTAVLFPLTSLVFVLDLAKAPEQAEQLAGQPTAATAYFAAQAEIVPATPHLEPESEKILKLAPAETTRPHAPAVQKRGYYSQVVQVD
jgi:hypothetical protein